MHGLVVNCIRLGIKVYDSSTQGARNLLPNEASSTLENVSPVQLQPPVCVRLSDSDTSSRLGFQIQKLRGRNATALFVYNRRTVLLYGTEDSDIMLIDNHQHGDNMGSVIVKGTFSCLPEFLNSMRSTLNMIETSYGELIIFC